MLSTLSVHTLAKVSVSVGAPGVPVAGWAVLGTWQCHMAPLPRGARSAAHDLPPPANACPKLSTVE